MVEPSRKTCHNCGAELNFDAQVCSSCGFKQARRVYETTGIINEPKPENQKALEKVPWYKQTKYIVVLVIVGLSIIGAFGSNPSSNQGDSSGSSSKPTYEWVLIQTIEFDTEGEYFDFIMTKIYDSFTVPSNCIKWKAQITWTGGDKDSYIKLTMWRYGADDDINIGQVYENSKQGTTDFIYDKIEKGRTYFIEASMINNLSGMIKVYVYVPS